MNHFELLEFLKYEGIIWSSEVSLLYFPYKMYAYFSKAEVKCILPEFLWALNFTESTRYFFYTYGRPEVCQCVCFCTIENIPRLHRDNHLVNNILSRGQTVGSDAAQSTCYELLLLATVYVGFIGECPTHSFGNSFFSCFINKLSYFCWKNL